MNHSVTEKRIIVIDAGIAGPTAAYRIQRAGLPVQVLEAEDHVGGRMSTGQIDGYRIARGACWLPSSYREMRLSVSTTNASLASDEQAARIPLNSVLR